MIMKSIEGKDGSNILISLFEQVCRECNYVPHDVELKLWDLGYEFKKEKCLMSFDKLVEFAQGMERLVLKDI